MKNILTGLLLLCGCFVFAQSSDNGFKIRKLTKEEITICPIGEHSSNLYLPPEFDRTQVNTRQPGVFKDSLDDSVTPEFIPAIDFVLDFLGNYINSEVTINVFIEVAQLGGSALAGAGPAFVVENFDYAPLKNTEYPIALAEKLLGKEINRSDQPDIIVTINSEFEGWFFEPNNPTGIRPNQIDLASVLTHEIIHGLGFTSNSNITDGNGFFGGEFPGAFIRNIVNGDGNVLIDDFENDSQEMATQFTSNDLYYNSEFYREKTGKPQLYAPSQFARGSSLSHLGEIYNGGRDALMTFSFGGGEVIYFPGDFTLNMLRDMGWDGIRIIHEPGLYSEDLNAAYDVLADVEADSGFEPSSFMLHYSTDNFQSVDIVLPMEFDDGAGMYKATLPAPGAEHQYQYYFEVVDGRGLKRTRPGGGPDHFFLYNYGVDTEAPIMQDANQVQVIRTFNSFPVNVIAIDDFSGVSKVSSIVKVNGVADTIPLTQSNISNNNFYFSTYTYERTFVPSDVIEYKFIGVDNSAAANTTIFPQDSFFKGEYIIDDIAPVLGHDPVVSVTNFDKSFKIIVSTFDDFTGIDKVFGVVFLNDEEPDTIQLTYAPTLFGEFYEGTFSFDTEFKSDDIIRYSIFGSDLAFTPNKSSLPEDGTTYAVNVIVIPDPVDFYLNDFESATADFNGPGFKVGPVSGFTGNFIQSAQHPYPEGGPGQVVNFTYELVRPIIVADTESLIEFDEIALVENGASGSRWPQENFFDYVIVEARDLRGTEYFPLLDGYDCTAYNAWRTKYESAINAQGISSATPTSDLLRTRIIDIRDNGDFVAGDTILVRFRLFSDNAAAGWGWMIDNLKVQDSSSSVDDILLTGRVDVFPNPVSDGMLNIKLQLEENFDEGYISIFDINGKMLMRQFQQGIGLNETLQINVGDIPQGMYLLELRLDQNNTIMKKFIKE